ncbi:MAG: hypothetical protein PHE89_02825 [Alphaproteobacteria bacterium]|nr:hypothetical protein [Alphaproteobacteria bacterium]
MKLVEIKDIRVGQVWQGNADNVYQVINSRNDEFSQIINNDVNTCDCFDDNGFHLGYYSFTQDSVHKKLIGKIGITHKIEDNRLIEIKRDKFVNDCEVDNVAKD